MQKRSVDGLLGRGGDRRMSELDLEDLKTIEEMHKSLKSGGFYGTLTEIWENGRIVLIEQRQTYKPKDFRSIVIRFNS